MNNLSSDEKKEQMELIASQLKELRDMHKLNIISDDEYEKRTFYLLHPNMVKSPEMQEDKPAVSEELLDQLKEIRDMHKLSVISDVEFEKKLYELLHKQKK
ncbi:SHOCT domain-containing protein [Megasphaera paucivorans]|uniref:Short C-terminal domain-containing protein n=1 Tax=Megasphaera paucivorans TaxID=349095 RepID=A0A1G9VEN1_9FIRM|nr:SHOCT domain-containing protein [Megasphaera paucivorans]SDM70315.1 Short C-terminal domain-containing protein [Megasphaera paucivorans]